MIDPSLRVPLVDARGNINPNLDSVSVSELGCCDSIGLPTDPEATGDGTVIAILKRNRTLLGAIAVSVAGLAAVTFIGSRLATDSVVATATAAAPSYGEGASVKLSTDLSGVLRTTAGGGGGNPTGGFLDSLRAVRLTTGQAHVGRATVDSILANFTHIGRVAVDSVLPNMTHIGRVSIDSSVLLFTSLQTGQLHAGRVAVDSILANFTHIGRVAVDSLLDSLVTIVGALPAGQNHLGRTAIDSVLGIGTAGQKTMANSVPVVLASDQSTVNVTCLSGCAGASEGATYTAGVFASAAAANKDHLDLFNASGSGQVLRIRSITVAPQLAAAITGLVQSFLVQKTSTAGATCTALTIQKHDTNNGGVPAQVTASTNCTTDPTSTFDWLVCSQDGEEARSGNSRSGNCYLHPANGGQPFTLREGQGVSVRSGALSGAWPVHVRIEFTMGAS